MNYVLQWLKRNTNGPISVDDYLEVAYFAGKRLEDLEGEQLEEVLELVESGELYIPTRGSGRPQ